MKRILFSKLLAAILFSSMLSIVCTSLYATDTLSVGKGGGIAGVIEQFLITSDGVLLKTKTIAGKKEVLFEGKVKKKKVKAFFNEYEELKGVQWNKPFNVYEFVRYSGELGANNIVWGNPKEGKPENVSELAGKITAFVNENASK